MHSNLSIRVKNSDGMWEVYISKKEGVWEKVNAPVSNIDTIVMEQASATLHKLSIVSRPYPSVGCRDRYPELQSISNEENRDGVAGSY